MSAQIRLIHLQKWFLILKYERKNQYVSGQGLSSEKMGLIKKMRQLIEKATMITYTNKSYYREINLF